MELRPYQIEAVNSVEREWNEERRNRTLLSMATGCGKTVIMSKLAERVAMNGGRTLLLAHRSELLDQAADKIESMTGLTCAREQAGSTGVGSIDRVVVGSVQTLMRESRLAKYEPDAFSHVFVDEAHHAVANSYLNILDRFQDAKVLGVTATPDRADKRGLAQIFDSLAYEYGIKDAIKDGWLCPIKALMVPLDIDISHVSTKTGDYDAHQLGDAIEPYLEAIADEMVEKCKGRKTVVFLPLVQMAKDFAELLTSKGLKACEVDGKSDDRDEILQRFQSGEFDVITNSMLLTEGWDAPLVDCIVVLRPTRSRALYCLDEKTEVLTRDGWKSDVNVGEDVLAFDPETGETKFVPAIAKVRRKLDDDEYFCCLKGQSSDIRVTNHHRMLYDDKRRNGWKFKEAADLARLRDGAYIPVSGHGSFRGVPLTDDEIRFIGWVMTDRTINGANNAIAISQASHQPWIEEIQDCIDGCNLKYGKHVRSGQTQFNETSPRIVWTISKGEPRGTHKDRRGWGYLEDYISKDLSPMLYDMDERQFDLMLETIHLADGSKQDGQSWTRRSYHISKGNKTFVERLQMMAVQRGYRASISVVKAGGNRKSDLYQLHLKKQGFIKVGSTWGKHARWTAEDGSGETCWCVQNELGTLVTRRNGKVAIVGNCQMVGRGTRLHPGKKDLLLLDFLWMTERHNLCRPASLLGASDEVTSRVEETIKNGSACDIMLAEEDAENTIRSEREAAMAERFRQNRHRKATMVDPMEFAYTIGSLDLQDYEPTFQWEYGAVTDRQYAYLKRNNIDATNMTKGMASKLIDALIGRQKSGKATARQVMQLERNGFRNPGDWTFEQASQVMNMLADNGWSLPVGFDPTTYVPSAI